MRIVSLCFRWLCYLLLGGIALGALLMYLDALVFYPSFAYHFEFYQLYFVITLLLLPFFRLRHPYLFISAEQFISLRQKALDQHHQDIASHHRGGRWGSNGVRVNPFEYTSPYTQSYDGATGLAYSLAKSFFMSLLFLLFAPLFYLGIFVHQKIKKDPLR